MPTTFWAEHSVTDLLEKSEYWLGMQGRLVEPVYKPAGSDHYVPVSWDEAFRLIADKLNGLDSPDQAAFYTSGRTANETAFVYQLFVRAFGTNNLPDCSNMCHESTGTAMAETIGIGKSTIAYDDFAKADLIIVMGQNPGTNHPRMLTALEDAKRNGAAIVAVNPLPEAGLIGATRTRRRSAGSSAAAPTLADQFLQIRCGGDMALLQGVSSACSRRRSRHPGTVLDHEFLAEHTLGPRRASARTSRRSTRTRCSPRPGSTIGRDGRAGRPLPRGRPRDHHLGDGPHAAPQGASTPSRRSINLLLLRGNIGKPGAGRVPDPRAQQRAGRPHDGHLGADARRVPRRARQPSSRFEPPRAHGVDCVQTHRGACSAARSRSGSRWAATSSPRSRTPPPPRRRCAAPS